MTILLDHEVDNLFPFEPEELLKEIVSQVLEFMKFPYEVEVSVLITDKGTIRVINQQQREIDRETDVLSFPMCEFDHPGNFTSKRFEDSISVSMETEEVLLGDIVLCQDVIRNQAKEYGHSEKREFAFLVVHSLLHLMGYDHMEEDERIQMEQKQREIMEYLNIPREG